MPTYWPPQLTSEHLLLLDHIRFNQPQNRVETDIPFAATLSSLLLADQHTISSGGADIIYTNNTTDENFVQLRQGFKDQSIVANQGDAGLLPPVVKKYITDLFNSLAFLNLTVDLTGSHTTRTVNITVPSPSITAFGLEWVTAEVLEVGDKLKYEIVDTTKGIKIYSQTLNIDIEVPVNDPLVWTFSHPLDFTTGENIDVSIFLVKANGVEKDWNRRPTNEFPASAFIIDRVRQFELIGVSINDAITLTGAVTKVHKLEATYLSDTTSAGVIIEVFNDIVSPFIVRDIEKKFNVNSTTIKIYNSDGVTVDHSAILNKRDTSVLFFKVGSTWYYSQEGAGETIALASYHTQSDDFPDNMITNYVSGTATIATGAVVISNTYMKITEQSSGVADDLDSITGGAEGDILLIRRNGTATITIKHAAGANKFRLSGSVDFDVASDYTTITFMHDGTSWCETARTVI